MSAHSSEPGDGMEKISVKIALSLLVIVSVSLPSGSFFGVPAKHLAYLLAVTAIGYEWIRQSARVPAPLIVLFVWSLAITLLFTIQGASMGVARPGDSIQEGIGVFTTISVVIFGLIAISQAWVTPNTVLQAGVIGALLFSLVKNTVAIGMSAGLMSFYDALSIYQVAFNARFVSSEIFGGLIRVNLIIYDFYTLLALSLCILYPDLVKGLNRWVRLLFIVSGAICVFFAFSRYLFLVSAIVLAYTFVVRWNNVARLAAVLVLVPAILLNQVWVSGAVEQRFNSTQNVDSDEQREEQITALIDAWAKSPIIGQGLGSYARSLIRDPRAPFSYEVQWVGFLLKTGVVGIALAIILIIAALAQITKKLPLKVNFPLVALFVLFLLGGFTNQYLITSGSGVYYLSILSAAAALRKKYSDNDF